MEGPRGLSVEGPRGLSVEGPRSVWRALGQCGGP